METRLELVKPHNKKHDILMFIKSGKLMYIGFNFCV